MRKKTVQKAFRDSLPVMAGYVFLGMGFGILLQDKGYSFWWAVVMSMTIYAGSMQFVAADLLSSGASLITTALMTVMINGRHLFYGLSMLEKYSNVGRAKPYLIFALTDETFSIACQDDAAKGVSRNLYYLLLSLFNQFYWVFGSGLGAFLGHKLTFDSTGIDFSMTALFTVLFLEQWLGSKQRLPAILGVVISVVCLLVFGPSDFVIPAMIGISIALWAVRGVLQKGGAANV